MAKDFTISGQKWKGYTDDPEVLDPEFLTEPSVNVIFTPERVAKTRPGFEDTGLDLAQANKRAEPFHFPHFDLTFFAVGTKVYYVEGDPATGTKYDTGITLTDGTTSTFEEYNGVVFVTNQTDGCYGFMVTRLNGAVTLGATVITTDVEGEAQASVFDTELSRSTGNLRINGTNEGYNHALSGTVTGAANNGSGLIRITSTAHGLSTGCSVTIASVTGTTEANGTWTVTKVTADTFDLQGSTFANAYVSGGTWTKTLNGTFPLTSTASQGYADNTVAIIVYDLTARFPKCDRIVAWKESLNFIGLSPDTGNAASSDRRQTALMFTQFATAAASENILKVTGGTSGTELVGKSGKLVNGFQTRDFIYLFKTNAVYFISVADVMVSSGARPPQVLSENYGCLNQFCAADMGNGEIVFLTQNNRIIRIKINLATGQASPYPDESFDTPLKNTLALMDADQTGARLYYAAAEKRLYCQMTVDGSKITLCYNNDIQAWEPPRNGWFFGGYFERKGILYGTEYLDDTVHKLGLTLDDNGDPIECVMASTVMQFSDGRVTCRWNELELSVGMTQNAEIQVETIVGRGTPQVKTFDATGVSFDLAPAMGAVSMGSDSLGDGPVGSEMGDKDKRFAIFPSLGPDLQVILSTSGEGQAFSWKSYTVRARSLAKSSLTLS